MVGGKDLRSRSDAVWSEQGTTPDAIEAALRSLLTEIHAENDDFLPARVLNMIAFVDREWSGEIANRLRGVGRYHASRLVVLAYEPRRVRLDARVMITSAGASAPGELALLHETVVVELGDRHLDDLLTITDPLVVTDLPTLLWSPHGHHEVVTELLALSQAVLLDSVEEPIAREALDRAWELTAQAYVVDLAWLRSTPWRERVAATFDPLWLRRELRTIASVTVRHHPASTAAAMLLVGWLASCLDWRTGQLVADGDALVGTHAGSQNVAVRLESSSRAGRARVGGPGARDRLGPASAPKPRRGRPTRLPPLANLGRSVARRGAGMDDPGGLARRDGGPRRGHPSGAAARPHVRARAAGRAGDAGVTRPVPLSVTCPPVLA